MSTNQSVRLFVASVALALSVVAAAGFFTSAAAQTPGQATCAPPFGRGAGGQAVTGGKIQILLPAGYNYLWNAPAAGSSGGILRVCIIEYMSQIELNSDTGAELSRVVAVGSASAVLDLIAASAHLTTPPTPTPAPQIAAAAAGSTRSGTGSISPPNTGDAGLR